MLNAIESLFNAHPVIVGAVIAALSSAVSSLITTLTNYPKTETVLHTIQGILSFAQHADVGGAKVPFLTKLKKPGVAAPSIVDSGAVKAFLFLFLLSHLSACATLSWTTPVVTAGPAVVPIEEVSAKSPTPAVATGFQETLGLGQFDFQGKEWDSIDLSLYELGGLALPGAGPAGMLQLGGGIGTLNGIVGVAVLADVVDANGAGLAQGGSTGPIYGFTINVQALTAYLSELGTSDELKVKTHLPRGGL